MNAMVSVSVIIGMFYLIFKFFGKGNSFFSEKSGISEEYNENEFYIEDVSQQLNNVNDIMNRVQALESLITDIEVCSPEEHLKNFTLKWADRKGINQSYDFIVDGNNVNTECIIEMAYAERSKLRTILKKEIRTLNECSQDISDDKYLNRGGEPCERY